MTKHPLKNILYVEDDNDIRALVEMSLQSFTDYHIDSCINGQDALDKGKNLTPQLVLLDVMMPDIDGPTVFRELKKLDHYKNTPFIFLTAKVQDNEVAEYKDMGAAGVISKPFDPSLLNQMIESIWNDFYQNKQEAYTKNLEQLKQNYLQNISQVISEIYTTLYALEQDALSCDDLHHIKLNVGNLLGSGKTFGFQDLTSSAQLLLSALDKVKEKGNQAILSGQDRSRISALMLALISIIETTAAGHISSTAMEGSKSFTSGQNGAL